MSLWYSLPLLFFKAMTGLEQSICLFYTYVMMLSLPSKVYSEDNSRIIFEEIYGFNNVEIVLDEKNYRPDIIITISIGFALLLVVVLVQHVLMKKR